MVQLLSNQNKINRIYLHQAINLVGLCCYIFYPFFYGVDSLFLSITGIGILIGTFVISAYYHRCLAHKSWKAPNWLHYIFLIIGAGFYIFPAIAWVAVHREHHKFYDTEKDPHGPKRGFINNLLITSMVEPKIRYMRKDARDKKLIWQAKYYWIIGAITFFVCSYFFGVISYLMLVGYIYLSVMIVNFLGHYKGLNNSHFLALFSGGEMYHKSHHANPKKPKMGLVDIAYYLVIKWYL